MSLKKIILIFIAICLGFKAPAQSQKLPDPNVVGKKAFNILKKLDQLSAKRFTRQMMNIRDFHNLIKEYNITDEQEILNITSMSKKKWRAMALNNYKGLEWYKEDHNIEWTKIEFSQYDYKIVEKSGIKYYKGLLEFTHLQSTHSWKSLQSKQAGILKLLR
ncbi:hypothetical protein OO013_07700 [Mangrovivirga sp. M17]|uniref:Uncharacterized protein n=1 Tax=Mangrovivirga halotolerans TaxID=2993936 RepID=A0ABT3RQV6_9BACT|nr:hypothetical protein [Mangrovivirga halotolerans]MCX2743743.1 hypothetical protein [Mangrovivirga halotolerans]